MNNSETTEKQNSIKYDHLNQLEDLILFILEVESRLSSIEWEDWSNGKKNQVTL